MSEPEIEQLQNQGRDDRPAEPQPKRPFQFGLSSLLLIMTLSAVMMSLFKIQVAFGIMGLILAIPALLRTIVCVTRIGAGGQPASMGRIVGIFLFSLVSWAVVGMFSASLSCCAFVIFYTPFIMSIGGYIGILAGLFLGGIAGASLFSTLVYVLWLSPRVPPEIMWSRRRRKPLPENPWQSPVHPGERRD